jgi:hypothetical protein
MVVKTGEREITFSWIPVEGGGREQCSHIQHNGPCRPGVPPPKRNRKSGGCAYRRGAGSSGEGLGLVLVLRFSRCCSMNEEGRDLLLTDPRYRSSPISVMQDTKHGWVDGTPANTEREA